MNVAFNKLAAFAAIMSEPGRTESPTLFSQLSQEAQDIIVNATLGMYDDGPPDMSDEVREEITKYMQTDGQD